MKLTKTQSVKSQMAIFVQVYELFTIAQLLALVIFVSVSLVRENLRGLRENLKHKILALVDLPLLLVQPEAEVGP